ncbi:MAG: hypothetical protein ACLU9S_09195 [Oscillospiraceae bacterium]
MAPMEHGMIDVVAERLVGAPSISKRRWGDGEVMLAPSRPEA